MNAPLSGKQHREFLKLQAQENRESAKMEREESRKQELHEIKLQEAAGGANQKMGHKEQLHQAKLQDLKSPLASRTQQPQQQVVPRPGPTDTVPAMLTPGEAVIPQSAAQDPKNKNAIRRMVAEGRGYAQGTPVVGASGLTGMIQVQNNLAVIPKVGPRKHKMGYEDGTTSVPAMGYYMGETNVPEFSRGSSAQAGYADGVTGVPDFNYGRSDVPGFANGTPDVGSFDAGTGGDSWDAPTVPQVAATQFLPDYRLSPEELQAQIMAESRGVHIDPKTNQLLISPAGARGLTQVMPATGAKPGYGVPALAGETEGDYKDFQGNYMAAMMKAYDKDKDKAFTAYNAGPGTVNNAVAAATKAGDPSKWRDFLPTSEAKNYYGRVQNFMTKNVDEIPQQYDAEGNPIKFSSQIIRDMPPPLSRDQLAESQRARQAAWGNRQASPISPATIPGPIPQFTRMDSTTSVNPPAIDLSEYKNVPSGPVPYVPSVPGSGFTDMNNVPYEPQAYDNDWFKTLGLHAEDKAPQVEAAKEAAAEQPPEQQKSFLEKAISSIFGDKDSMFQPQDLARFAMVAAGGMLSGGSTGGSLRYAGRDVMSHADTRMAQAATENRAYKAQQAAEDRVMAPKLIAEGYSPENVREAMRTGDYSKLGTPRSSIQPTGKTGVYTFDTGPNAGQRIETVEMKTMNGSKPGAVEQYVKGTNIPVAQYMDALRKAYPDKAKSLANMNIIPHDEFKKQQDEGIKQFSELNKSFQTSVDKSYNSLYGPADTSKGGGNIKRANMPTSSEIANEATKFFRERGLVADNATMHESMTGVFNNALRDMTSYPQEGKVISFTPYLAKSMLIGRSGIDSGAFDLGAGKPMDAGKIKTLIDVADRNVSKADPRMDPSEREQLKNEKLAKLYQQFKTPSERKTKVDSQSETAFYQYAMDKLK